MAITLYENLRAVFYATFYAANELGAFTAEGADVRLQLSPSPAATAVGLLDGSVDVAWGGPMRILYTHDQKPDCGLVGFCEVVTRDPFFLVGNAPRPDFQVSDLEGLRIGTVSEVPTPWLCLQHDIRLAGRDPAALDRVSDRTMAENAAALREGKLDVMQAYQPFVEELVREGAGHIWYASASRGATSYTTFYARAETLRSDKETMLAMTRAMYRTQKWLHSAEPSTIAATIARFFPDLEPDLLSACMARYQALGIWGHNPLLPRGGFDRLRDSCLSGDLIQRGAVYEDCVDNSLAQIAVDEDPPTI